MPGESINFELDVDTSKAKEALRELCGEMDLLAAGEMQLLRSSYPTIGASDIDELPPCVAEPLRELIAAAGYDLDRVESVSFDAGRIHSVTLLHVD